MQSIAEVARPAGHARELRRAFQKRIDAGYIESVHGRDIDLQKEGERSTWPPSRGRASCPSSSNVSLLIEFEARAER